MKKKNRLILTLKQRLKYDPKTVLTEEVNKITLIANRRKGI